MSCKPVPCDSHAHSPVWVFEVSPGRHFLFVLVLFLFIVGLYFQFTSMSWCLCFLLLLISLSSFLISSSHSCILLICFFPNFLSSSSHTFGLLYSACSLLLLSSCKLTLCASVLPLRFVSSLTVSSLASFTHYRCTD